MGETRIVAAAYEVRGVTFSIPRPARHGDIIRRYHRIHPAIALDPDDSGFLTNEGLFIGREEAWQIANRAGQIIRRGPCSVVLYSEDLW